ncbi:hypothetical protein ACJIZ3_020378 [Penstemon smallii]|uniref:Uncharacterized protein n=1 Tax=Penstemon smallii TaxID=265156 RepID=A0ABD3SIF1_9LAMI
MCYPAADRKGTTLSASSGRQSVLPEAAREQQQRVNTNSGLAEVGGGTTKVCLCSPTSHPGSFRCRQHHGQYQWVNRLGPKPNYFICTRNRYFHDNATKQHSAETIL